MKAIKDVNPAQAYIEGMLWTAYGVRNKLKEEGKLDSIATYGTRILR